MANHHLAFARGIVKASAVVYELSVVYVALLAATLVLKLSRWNR